MADHAVILRAFFESRELALIDRGSVPIDERIVSCYKTQFGGVNPENCRVSSSVDITDEENGSHLARYER